jgi:predicted DNA-binding transcriptional regulator AlpA
MNRRAEVMNSKPFEKKYIRVTKLAPELDVSVPTVWRWAKENPLFPKPVRLSARVTAWKVSEVQAWLDAKAKESV